MPAALSKSRAGVRAAGQASMHKMTTLVGRSGRENTLDPQRWALGLNQEKPCMPRIIAGCSKGLVVVMGISRTKGRVTNFMGYN